MLSKEAEALISRIGVLDTDSCFLQKYIFCGVERILTILWRVARQIAGLALIGIHFKALHRVVGKGAGFLQNQKRTEPQAVFRRFVEDQKGIARKVPAAVGTCRDGGVKLALRLG